MKWIGALLIIGGCGFFGFYTSAMHNMEERSLRKLIAMLDYISCELQYKLTPLPDLCRQAGKETSGNLRRVFLYFADELDSQIFPDVKSCMHAALSQCPNLPDLTKKCLVQLSTGMGRFDLSGQIQILDAVRTTCRNHLSRLEAGKDVRLRTYQTLGLCAGAALVILFV